MYFICMYNDFCISEMNVYSIYKTIYSRYWITKLNCPHFSWNEYDYLACSSFVLGEESGKGSETGK